MRAIFRRTAIIALVSLYPAKSQSATIYDSHGFESPTFSLSPLPGQDPANGPWLAAGLGGTAEVVASAPGNGTQVVRYTRGDDDSRAGVVKPISNVASSPDGPIISVEWSMSYDSSSTALNFGPFFAVEVYDEVAGFPLLAASAGIDAKTGEVLFQAPGTGFLTPTGDIIAADSWQNFRLELDYASDTYDLFLNGNLILDSAGFVDAGIDGFNDVTLAALGAAPDDDFFASGVGYFDDLRVTSSGAVPSAVPDAGSTAVLMTLGAAAVGFARRR